MPRICKSVWFLYSFVRFPSRRQRALCNDEQSASHRDSSQLWFSSAAHVYSSRYVVTSSARALRVIYTRADSALLCDLFTQDALHRTELVRDFIFDSDLLSLDRHSAKSARGTYDSCGVTRRDTPMYFAFARSHIKSLRAAFRYAPRWSNLGRAIFDAISGRIIRIICLAH